MRHRNLCLNDLISAVVAEVQDFGAAEQTDDITLIVARGRS